VKPAQDLTEAEAVIIAEDYVPTVDQADEDKPPPATYRDWVPEQTRVITYTNDLERYPRDRYAPTIAKAKAECELAFGPIKETNAVPGRWFFRVAREVRKV
jgi:hypothetical protein